MMTIQNSLKQDIRLSIATNSVVGVDTNGAPITDIMATLSVMDGVEDADYAQMDDGIYDVWGTMDYGAEFRLLVTAGGAR